MPQPISHPVILGAGQLGLAVMDELAPRNLDVIVVNRSGTVDETLPPNVTLLAADLYDPAAVRAVCAGADTVFLCAQPAYTDWPEKFPPLIDAVLTGLDGMECTLVFGDNLYMYGPTGGAPISEELPYAATGRKGRTRAAMARTLLDAHGRRGLNVVIGRASDFYGPRVTASAMGEMVVDAALAGKPVNLLGNVDLPHTYTYIRDFARALVRLAEEESAWGDVWHTPNAPAGTSRDLVDLLAAATGQPVRIRAAGRLMVTVLGLVNPTVREFKEMYYEFSEPYIVDDSKYRAVFGHDATTPADGIAETVDWYRQRTASVG